MRVKKGDRVEVNYFDPGQDRSVIRRGTVTDYIPGRPGLLAEVGILIDDTGELISVYHVAVRRLNALERMAEL